MHLQVSDVEHLKGAISGLTRSTLEGIYIQRSQILITVGSSLFLVENHKDRLLCKDTYFIVMLFFLPLQYCTFEHFVL